MALEGVGLRVNLPRTALFLEVEEHQNSRKSHLFQELETTAKT